MAGLVLVPEISPYAQLKHLWARDNGMSSSSAQRELVDIGIGLFVRQDGETLENKFRTK